MNKLCLASLVMTLFATGCGKKKVDVKKNDTKKMAKNGDIPLFTSDKDELVGNESVDSFAFVDEELDENALMVASDKDQKAKNIDQEGKGSNELVVSTDQQAADGLAFARVQFDFNKNDIRKDQVAVVQADIAAAQQAVKEGKQVVVQGHTCQIGSAAYNLALSQRRAEAVKAEMVKNGISADLVKTVGFGYESPLVWSDATDRAVKIEELSPNRRAELITK